MAVPRTIMPTMTTDKVTSSAGGPSKYLNMVHQELKPGRNTEYEKQLAAIAKGFAQAQIGAYWVEFGFPQEKTLAFNMFDSLAEQDTIMSALGSGYAANPDLVEMADHLLSENVSKVESTLGKRIDDLGYRWDAIDFSKARILLVNSIAVWPGYELEFAEADRERAAAYERSNVGKEWVVYEALYGYRQPTFVALTPYASFQQMEESIASEQAIESFHGGTMATRIRELARTAYAGVESLVYLVNPNCSYVPAAFAAGDPEFWVNKSR